VLPTASALLRFATQPVLPTTCRVPIRTPAPAPDHAINRHLPLAASSPPTANPAPPVHEDSDDFDDDDDDAPRLHDLPAALSAPAAVVAPVAPPLPAVVTSLPPHLVSRALVARPVLLVAL
jgi:hypothetical protein